MTTGPGSQSSLREANAARVLEAVRKYGQLTQVELAASTGLSQASVSNIVKRLVKSGILEARNTIRSGRRAQSVSLARHSGLVAGLQIGRRGMAVAIADSTLEIQEKISLPLPVDHRPDTTLDRAAILVAELLDRMGAHPTDLLAAGVAVPAPIDPTSEMIAVPGILPGWDNIAMGEVLSKRLNRSVLVDNDANAALLAESRFGSLRGVSNAMYLRASYATGAAIKINGEVHRGAHGTAGEIGHVQIEPTGLICRCGGRGCLNTVVGAEALVDLLRLNRGELSLSDMINFAMDDDPGCRQVIVDAAAQVGGVLADFAILFEPSKIVVGGELVKAGDMFLDPIRTALASHPLLRDAISVEKVALGGNAELMGALILANRAAQAAASAGTTAVEDSTHGDEVQ